MEIAQQIRRNAQEQQNVLRDLNQWESDIKSNPKKPVQANQVPSRSERKNTANNVVPAGYDKWDKFDTEAELEKIDYQESQSPLPLVDPLHNEEESLFYKLKGNSYFSKQMYSKSIFCYTKSISFNTQPSNASYLNRAQCYILHARYSESINDCDHVLSANSKCVKALFRKSKALIALGRLIEAKNCLEHSKIIEPMNQSIKLELQNLYGAIKNQKANGGIRRRRLVIEEVGKKPDESQLDRSDKDLDMPIISRKEVDNDNASFAMKELLDGSKQGPETVVAVDNNEPKYEIVSEAKALCLDQFANDLETTIDTIKEVENENTSLAMPITDTYLSGLITKNASTNELQSNEAMHSPESAGHANNYFQPDTLVIRKAPESMYVLENEWKSCASISDLSEYFALIPHVNLPDLFKTSFNSKYLSDIFAILLHVIQTKVTFDASAVLWSISRIARFNLIVSMCDKHDQSQIKRVFEVAGLLEDSEANVDLRKKYKVKF